VPGTRLLVIADSKMLLALANGLRDGLRFDVLTVPLTDPAGAQAAAGKADAIALFYGAPGSPLPAALQALSPKVRERGGRVIAVLQREQAAQRDECFRAGASDLLYMPMPKDQFVARLQGSVELSWAGESGAPVPVSVATRTATSKVENASISPAGIEAPGALPVKAGDTVRLSWGAFQTWGLVVRSGPSTQIRFAGLTPDEEAQIKEWLKAGAKLADPEATPPGGSAAVAAAKPAAVPAPAPEASAAPPSSAPVPAPASAPAPASGPAPAPAPAAAKPSGPQPSVPPGGRAAPSAGPPPGFADRKTARSQARTPVRIPPPVMTGGGARTASVPPPGAPAPSAEAAAPAPSLAPPPPTAPPPLPAAVDAPGATTNGTEATATPALAGIFEEGAAAAPGEPPAAAQVPVGPSWPVPAPVAACKAVAMQLLKDKTLPPDAAPSLSASARKLTNMLGSAERAALDKAGPDSHLADALGARIALDAATAEGVKLYSSSPAAIVDANAVAALTRLADEAAARLQKEANAAVGKGEVEALQMVTAASASLSRDMLSFKETADRLRGLGAAPRLGAGALDPDMVLPGQAPRPKQPTGPGAPAPVRAELRDFQNLESNTPRTKRIFMALALVGFIIALANALYFGLPHQKELSPDTAGNGVQHIEVAGEAAMVTVSPEWLGNTDAMLPILMNVLRDAGVKKAVLVLPNGSPAGLLDITTGKVSGLLKPKPPR
jgi:DNA-binding NarL/FixJ family response regulator